MAAKPAKQSVAGHASARAAAGVMRRCNGAALADGPALAVAGDDPVLTGDTDGSASGVVRLPSPSPTASPAPSSEVTVSAAPTANVVRRDASRVGERRTGSSTRRRDSAASANDTTTAVAT